MDCQYFHHDYKNNLPHTRCVILVNFLRRAPRKTILKPQFHWGNRVAHQNCHNSVDSLWGRFRHLDLALSKICQSVCLPIANSSNNLELCASRSRRFLKHGTNRDSMRDSYCSGL